MEQMIQAAIAKGMIVFSLTEHMPRDCMEDLYPEEVGFTLSYLRVTLGFLHLDYHLCAENSMRRSPNDYSSRGVWCADRCPGSVG